MTGTTFERANSSAYETEIMAWRRRMDESLRSETGWLTLTGLYWLREGRNTLGSDGSCDILLPDHAPKQLGFIDFEHGAAQLHISDGAEVTVGEAPAKTALLRADDDPGGPTRVEIGAVNFIVIKRGNQYGVRVRDRSNPARQGFTGRRWLPVDPNYRLTAAYTPHPTPRKLEIMNVVGILTPMDNPGWVEFEAAGQTLRLEAFDEGTGELWFVFRDANPLTYKGGRYLYARLNGDGTTAVLDFNKAYNPPCVFTPYATCPLPPEGNHLAVRVEAGEIMPPEA